MKTYRMIVKTTNPETDKMFSEYIHHVPENELIERQETIRRGQPRGSVFSVIVIEERR